MYESLKTHANKYLDIASYGQDTTSTHTIINPFKEITT